LLGKARIAAFILAIDAIESTRRHALRLHLSYRSEDQSEEPAAADGNFPAKVGHSVTVYSQETAERVYELIDATK
jgi:hypothetical protein